MAWGNGSSLIARRGNEKRSITPHRTSQQVVMLWLIKEPTFALCDLTGELWGRAGRTRGQRICPPEDGTADQCRAPDYIISPGRRDFNFRASPVCLGDEFK